MVNKSSSIISSIILNSTALGVSAYLSWSLYQTYNAQVFTCVGAPKAITDLYKYFLALQVTLQLELFVLLTAAGLWTSQLFNSYITHISKHTPIYEALVSGMGRRVMRMNGRERSWEEKDKEEKKEEEISRRVP
ncbi:hypothetical protein DFJ43DRAFT_1227850 [Lentinula guzmanii]|uniref:Uncharacterized protein n=2 Tax=Lentinula TaxID=5352 RepID=A0AA38JAA8_9AGAR|nr:hypothetical protein DFJ43DRAFT_1227850 [Lentinula guzmanii]KAJ3787900.1 hypothetical protein GGU10DRAFT_373516 [Lentinula aff. detonsa]KAJ3794206.1 hypothetical protein GGU11DRAFT_748186 [Lentinula aff. detonsa]